MAKKQTYATRAKSIMNKYKPRLGEKFDKGDTLALEAMNQELTALQQEQEMARLQEQHSALGAVFANGGDLTKVPKRFKKTLSELALSQSTPFVDSLLQGQKFDLMQGQNQARQEIVYPSSLELDSTVNENYIPFGTRRDARRFMRQAPKVSSMVGREMLPGSERPLAEFRRGGGLPMYEGTDPDQTSFLPGADLGVGSTASDYTLGSGMMYADPYDSTDQMFEGQMSVGDLRNLEANNWMRPSDPTATAFGQAQAKADAGGIYGQPGGIIPAQETNPASPAQTIQPQGDGFQPFKSRVPWIGAAASGLGSVLANRNIDFGDDQYTAQQVAPNLVDYSREREQFGRDRDIANQMVRRGAAGFGSRSKLMQNLQAGATGTQRQEGRLFSKSLQGEQNQNAMIKNQASQFNAQQRSMADRLNTQQDRENLLINEGRRGNRITGVTNAISGYGKDLMRADQYDQMLQIMAPENYRLGIGDDSLFRQLVQASPTMKRDFTKGTDPRLYQGKTK